MSIIFGPTVAGAGPGGTAGSDGSVTQGSPNVYSPSGWGSSVQGWTIIVLDQTNNQKFYSTVKTVTDAHNLVMAQSYSGTTSTTSPWEIVNLSNVPNGNVRPAPPPPTPPTPPTPPPSGTRLIYDYNADQAQLTSDLPDLIAATFNTFFCACEWTTLLSYFAANGLQGWATVGQWNDAAGSFSYTDSQAVAVAQAAQATAGVQYLAVADEPTLTGGAGSSAPSIIRARAQLLTEQTGLPTLMTCYDIGVLPSFAGVTSVMALDIYPCNSSYSGGFQPDLITELADSADSNGVSYYGIVQTFTAAGGGGTYTFPTTSPSGGQLATIFSTWKATGQLGWGCYAWGNTNGMGTDMLQDNAAARAIIAAE